LLNKENTLERKRRRSTLKERELTRGAGITCYKETLNYEASKPNPKL
jgi:hypothetical protein